MYLRRRMLTNTLQHIDEVVVWIDGVQPTGHQQALHDANVLGAEFGPTEQPVFAIILCRGSQLSAVCDYAQYRTPSGVGSRRTYGELCIISKAFEELQ